MTDFIVYSIKSGVCLAVFYAFYRLLLAKDTHVKRNRFFLLLALLFSILLPLFNFMIEHEQMAKTNQFVWEFEHSIEDQFLTVNSGPSHYVNFDFSFWVVFLYALGVFLILGRLILNLVSIIKIIQANEIIKHGDLNLIYIDHVHSPYSFFNYVFLNPSILSKTEKEQVLLHESIHSKQLHSIDLLTVEVLIAFFWFNPIIYLFKNALVEVHEYCADKACTLEDANKIGYQQCLLQHIESKMNLNLTSAFNSSLTLKRIKMIKKSNTSVLAHFKLILILPVLLVSMLSFDYSEIKSEKLDDNKIIKSETSDFITPIKFSSKVRVSAFYGERIHPIRKKKFFHRGVDIAAPKGTPIYAVANGTINKLKTNHVEGKSYGRYIIIEHEGNIASLYSQMESYAVSLGQKVKKGELIGYVGRSGISTGPHLHFEIKKNGKYVNPEELIDLSSLQGKK